LANDIFSFVEFNSWYMWVTGITKFTDDILLTLYQYLLERPAEEGHVVNVFLYEIPPRLVRYPPISATRLVF